MMLALQSQMYERFPLLFRAPGVPDVTFDGAGIRVGDGWHSILYSLCEEIERHVAATALNPHPCFTYVKKESRRLSIGVEHADQFVLEAIARAEQKSADICDLCGAPANAEEHYWILKPCEKDKAYGASGNVPCSE